MIALHVSRYRWRNLLVAAILLCFVFPSYGAVPNTVSDNSIAVVFDRFTAEAEQGLAEAQYNLAIFYEEGLGVQPDIVNAMYWYRKAAEQGHIRSQYKLGLIYLDETTLPMDSDQGIEWLRLAARQDDANSFYKLGQLFSDPQSRHYHEVLARSRKEGSSVESVQVGSAIYR